MHPFRFSVLTFNLWNTERWEARERTVEKFLRTYDPDICCFQELRSSTVAVLDRVLSGHARVRDPFRGWTEEGNLYFRKGLFSEIEHGAVDLSMPEPDRRLFWVRLGLPGSAGTLLACTVHLTHQENADEIATGKSYRHGEAHIIAESMPRIARELEPTLVCGDFNDPIHPARILSEAGFTEVFYALGLVPPATFPSQPCSEEIYLNESIDKIMAKGPLAPLLASSPNYMAYGSSGSDHWPVMAVYELRGGGPSEH